jgi:hypothetical protein
MAASLISVLTSCQTAPHQSRRFAAKIVSDKGLRHATMLISQKYPCQQCGEAVAIVIFSGG